MRPRSAARLLFFVGAVVVFAAIVVTQQVAPDPRIQAAAVLAAAAAAALAYLRAARCPRCRSPITPDDKGIFPTACQTCNRDLRRKRAETSEWVSDR